MRKAAFSLIVTVIASAALSANWPAWRGPSGDGVSSEKNLPVKWSPTENIAWKLALPQWSGATPVIWGNTVFLNVAEADGDQLSLWAVSRTNGDILWKKLLSTGNNKQRKQNMSSPSPVTDGTTVWVVTGTGILKAFDFKGAELWTRDIQKDYGRFGLNWGYANSPLLHDGDLFVPVLHGMKTDDPSYMLRIDGKSGKTEWKVERPNTAIRESPDAYITPALARVGKGFEIILNGADVVTGHDPATGKELWRANGLNPDNDPSYRIVASPVTFGDIVIAPTRERPMLVLTAGGRGDVTTSHKLWSFQNGPDVPTPVTDGTYVYVVNDRGIAYCLELKTGKPVYGPERLEPGTYSASPVLADGKIYITNEDGVASVYRAGPTFELLAENKMDDYTLSSIAVKEGQLFLRTAGWLWVIGQRKAAH
ncbi:MAG TPA: PQQ-binding-like beta-propeller repeat protein [Vicinamibacterales bacterium]|nr:PQQ-binding-like beta-propeller repeat protein [Vicinamibacterales bacterium]